MQYTWKEGRRMGSGRKRGRNSDVRETDGTWDAALVTKYPWELKILPYVRRFSISTRGS